MTSLVQMNVKLIHMIVDSIKCALIKVCPIPCHVQYKVIDVFNLILLDDGFGPLGYTCSCPSGYNVIWNDDNTSFYCTGILSITV